MPSITSGSNATFTVPANYVIDIQCPGGWVQLEYPVGTKVFEGNPAGRTFGPYAAGSAKLTSVKGDIYYEVDPSPSATVPFDPTNVGFVSGLRTNEFYNFTGANTRKWRSALARHRIGGARAKIVCAGDSTTRGMGSNPANLNNASEANSYPEQLAVQLTAGGLAAEANSFLGSGGATTATLASVDPRISLGSWTVNGAVLTLGGAFLQSPTSASNLTFLPTSSVDTFDIYYAINNGLGTATCNINGGAVLATMSGNGGSQALGKQTVSGSLASNTLGITWSSGGVGFFVLGIDGYNSTAKQIAVMNAGWSGMTVANYQQGNPWGTSFMLPALAPDLTIVCLTINDAAAATDITQYKTSLQTLITTALQTGDVILMTGVPSNTANATAVNQAAIVAANYALAQSNNIPLVDLTYRWGDFTTSNGLSMYFDNLHPSARGYSDVAKTLANALLAMA